MANTKSKKSTSPWRLSQRTKDIMFELTISVPGSIAVFVFALVVIDMYTGWFFTYN